ncbi:sensor domain-containing diguanylate cyclase [Oceanobacillus manasiensis]|uniref:sensor domain-containing diguanylate cyclase n=1 Tax=Oceanobacillus manasiensis TaxID=586413 RepID=UPI000693A7F1|nr:sensor domain-containing diguanylate cyclase [Oceanobacillus manasiensis]
MKKTELLVDRLRSLYFDLVTKPLEQSDAIVLCHITECISEILPISNLEFYMFNEWQREYELCNFERATKEVPLDKQRLSEGFMSGETIYLKLLPEKQVSFIDLEPKNGPKAILCIEHKLPIMKEALEMVKVETEKLISVLQLDGVRMTRNRAYLFELTSQLLSMTSKEKILSEIIHGLSNLYPELSYNLLLSQDTEVDSGLPVKKIEYSDGVTKRVSTMAFITGEVQLEKQLDDACCALYAPLIGKQGVYGVLQVISYKGMYFPKKEVDFISQIASTAGKAIENVTLYEKSNLLVSDLKLINDATHKLNSNLEMKEIIRHVRDKVMDVCHATEVGFIYYNEKNEKKYDVLGGSTAYFNSAEGKEFAEYLLNYPVCSGEPIFKGDYNETEDFPYRSLMVIPMSHSGTEHGLVVIMHQEPYFFSFSTFKLMQTLIQHSALALTNTILKEKLEKAVITDFLTSLYSRNYLEEQIICHMETGEKGTLILFDIDDFKSINDTYGHHVGDEVLQQVSNLIISIVSKQDIAARWGGEELAVYMPTLAIDEGVQVAGIIRSQVEKYTHPTVTLSCGVSSWNYEISDTVSELFIRADKALYKAKNTGKNSVVKYRKTL